MESPRPQTSVITAKELETLNQLQIGMLGYGAQGSAEAKNLKKSGLTINLGLREGGPSDQQAKEDGFVTMGMAECIEKSQVLLINLPDQNQASIYKELIKGSNVRYIVFAHGFNTHFELIPVEKDGPKHILIAPKGAASGLERLYGSPQALPAILGFRAAERDVPNDEEKNWIEILARAMGSHPKGLVWADFKDEAVCDLFSEQALLCGGVSSLLRRTYEVLIEAGYNKETAYYETLYELKLIVDMIWDRGITGMRAKISPTARYGDITRGDRIFDDEIKKRMRSVLKEVEDGTFAHEFLDKIGSKEFQGLQKTQADHPIESMGAELRKKLQP